MANQAETCQAVHELPLINGHSCAVQVSIGTEAVDAAEAYLRTGERTGESAIEQISWVRGHVLVCRMQSQAPCCLLVTALLVHHVGAL